MKTTEIPRKNKIVLRSGKLYNMIESDVIIPSNERVTIQGLVTGDVDVESHAILELNGMVLGMIRVGEGGKAIINGMVMKSVEEYDGDVKISGRVIGDVIQHKGNVVYDKTAIVGKRITK